MQFNSQIPFGYVIQPLAEQTTTEYQYETGEVPVIECGEEGPFRCMRCKCFSNPNMQFMEGG